MKACTNAHCIIIMSVYRLVIDVLGRCTALWCTPEGGGGGPPTATVIVLELGGGVTVVEGLLAPVRHLLSGLPTRLRDARAAVLAARSEALRLFSDAVADESGDAWAADLAARFVAEEETPAPLDWANDSDRLAATWARHFTLGADPFVPRVALSPPSSWDYGGGGAADSPFSRNLRQAAAAREGFSAVDGEGIVAMGAAAASAEPWPLRAVLHWTPSACVWCVTSGHVSGLAWRLLPPLPLGSASSLDSNDLEEVVCDLDCFSMGMDRSDGGGDLSWVRIPPLFSAQPLPHREDELRDNGALEDLGAGSPLPRTVDPRELRIRKLLAATGWLDHRAAHVPSLRLAASLRAVRCLSSDANSPASSACPPVWAPLSASALPPGGNEVSAADAVSPLRVAVEGSVVATWLRRIASARCLDDDPSTLEHGGRGTDLVVSTGFDDALGPALHRVPQAQRAPVQAVGGSLRMAALAALHIARGLSAGAGFIAGVGPAPYVLPPQSPDASLRLGASHSSLHSSRSDGSSHATSAELLLNEASAVNVSGVAAVSPTRGGGIASSERSASIRAALAAAERCMRRSATVSAAVTQQLELEESLATLR